MRTDASIAVAIDGPMGSGKSTVAREVARRLGFRYIDTGAMYRAVAAAALRAGVRADDADGLARLAREVHLVEGRGATRVTVNGADITDDLRSVAVNRIVGGVARVPAVREALGCLQRAVGSAGDVVMEGRDIGSVILPAAEVKVYLTASPDARATRRQAELAAAGETLSIEEVRRIEAEDDRSATTRVFGPLVLAPGAVVIDSTALSVDEVVKRILALVVRARGL